MVFTYNGGRSPWYPLHQAAKRWNEEREEAHQIWEAARDKAKEEDVDGNEGEQERDRDGYLKYPHEDKVPYRAESSDDE